MITIYTDGSCLKNPGPGGWALLILRDEEKNNSIHFSGGNPSTTNNQMELQAVLEALLWVKTHAPSEKIILFTDSMYVQQGITLWIHGWKKNGWKTASRQAVKNQELWQRLDQARFNLAIEWKWVKAHNGQTENEFVDRLAREQALQYHQGIS